ncbi:DUF3093 domain-containing protein [Goodfellowiella coeruleoviolacea]|uniref:DUF3093 domain-containing protein n=1 Tax=Goodfellowiella coeruleoviolacea TaxID=334858 RepID=A0AAE3GJ29_9PSEU|nr:DUF3093 domain-containing protein [Goodfellowiella coeruleoviolacea]MCP2168327.1 Protein of unknown function (DUF3093) [Goodfellowiella coeruleoviolacea]
MTRENSSEQPGRQVRPEFSERLSVPWWGWPLPLVAGCLLAAEVNMGFPGIWYWLPYLVAVPLVVLLLLMFGRTRVRLADDELWVGDAHLPVEFIDSVEAISAKDKRKALGPELDPRAFVLHRGWVGPVLRVRLNDPDDPTPYWLFSVRAADRLAELLRERIR